MINYEKDVREFHDKFGPFTIEQQQAAVEEECKELAIAILQGDRVAIARECADVIYASVGMLNILPGAPRIDRARLGWDVSADPVEQVRALLDESLSFRDVIEMAHGLAECYSILLPEIWNEVHAANMRKEKNRETCPYCNGDGFMHKTQDEPCSSCVGRGGWRHKPTKPPGWIGPNVAGVLLAYDVKLANACPSDNHPGCHCMQCTAIDTAPRSEGLHRSQERCAQKCSACQVLEPEPAR